MKQCSWRHNLNILSISHQMSKQTNAKAPISSVTEEKSSAHKVMRHILIRKFCGKKYHIFTFVSSSSSSVSSLSSRWSRLGRELRTLKKAVDLWLRFGDQDIIAAPPYFMIIIILLLLIVIIITIIIIVTWWSGGSEPRSDGGAHRWFVQMWGETRRDFKESFQRHQDWRTM